MNAASPLQDLPNPYLDAQIVRLPSRNRFANVLNVVVASVVPAAVYYFQSSLSEHDFAVYFGISLLLPIIPVLATLKALAWSLAFSPDGMEISGILSRRMSFWRDIASVSVYPHLAPTGNVLTEYVAMQLKSGEVVRTPNMSNPNGQFLGAEISRRAQGAVY
jgi:hypothetical protein